MIQLSMRESLTNSFGPKPLESSLVKISTNFLSYGLYGTVNKAIVSESLLQNVKFNSQPRVHA